MQVVIGLLIAVAAVINLLPVAGVLSSERLQAFYGVAIDDPNLAILLRHRAVLFGIAGALLAVAVFHPPLRSVAAAAGFASMLSFIALVWTDAGANAPLRRIAWVDVVASVALAIALVLDARQPV
jgi:hypothetical protein